MKNKEFKRIVILACAFLICTITGNLLAIEKSSNTKDKYLSVRESLIPMVNFAFRSNKYFPVHRINPNVRPYILFYLEKDNSNYDFVAGGIWLLGVIGTEDDIEFVDHYIQSELLKSPNDRFTPKSHIVAGASGCFAGMMMKRNKKGAEQFFQKYGKVIAWMPSENSPKVIDSAQRRYSYFIMGAYRYSKADFVLTLLRQKSSGSRPFLHESFVDGLQKLEIDEYTEMMRPGDTSEETLKKYRMDFLNNNPHWLDMLMRKQTLAQWRQAHLEKKKAVSRVKKKIVDSFESVDMSETVEGGYLKALGSEAANAYGLVSNILLDRNDKSLPIKKEILQDIQKAGRNKYEGFRIKLEVEAKINDFVPLNKGIKGNAAVPVVVKEKETAAVEFNIRDTADIFKKHVPDAGVNSLTSLTTGDVKINMKRTNRKWNWGNASDSNVSSVADIVEDNYLIDSVNEAMTAYAQITSMLIDGNYDPLEIPVLDNGKLIPLEKRQRTKDEMVKALDFEKRILRDVLKSKLNDYGDFRVKLEFEATLDNFAPAANGVRDKEGIGADGTKPVVVKGYETAAGTFIIRDAAKIYNKHASKKSGSDSIDRAGNLHVYMKRINGKWYWNPFGW